MNKWVLFPSKKPIPRYDNHEYLFLGLQKMENAAILYIQTRTMPTVRRIVREYGLPESQAEDILNSSTLVFLRKIEEGAYVFQGTAPSTYLIEITKRMALMATRTAKKTNSEPLDNFQHLSDESWETEQKQRDAAELMRRLLVKLGNPCQEIVRLHHIDGYSDMEVVEQRLTRYTTTDSLKMKRSDCMKKLIQLAEQWKTLINI